MSLTRDHRIVAVAELIRGHHVLDVGAGPCLLEPYVDGSYTAVDLANTMLSPGERRAVATSTHLPFRDGSFDTVTCISVLQYVRDVEAAVRELTRVLRPGGQLILLVPNLGYIRNRLTVVRGRIPWSSRADSWREGTIRYFTLPDLAPMLRQLNLQPDRLYCSGRARRLRSRFRPQLLGADLIFDLDLP